MNQISHKELTQDDVDLYFFYRKHGINDGFFHRYFHHLKGSETTVEAFRTTNMEYFDLFGEAKYSTINSFRNQLKKYITQ